MINQVRDKRDAAGGGPAGAAGAGEATNRLGIDVPEAPNVEDLRPHGEEYIDSEYDLAEDTYAADVENVATADALAGDIEASRDATTGKIDEALDGLGCYYTIITK